MRFNIAHISDLHFGKTESPHVIERLGNHLNASNFDLIVATGDFTQRSKRKEWTAAQKFISSLETPVLAVPGNHDLPPYWKPLQRLFLPNRSFDSYLKEISCDHKLLGEVLFVGINSTLSLVATSGIFRFKSLLKKIEQFRKIYNVQKIVVCLHHPLLNHFPGQAPGIAKYYDRYVSFLNENDIKFFLHGHLHRSFVLEQKIGENKIIHCCAGTATSRRSREISEPLLRFNAIGIHGDRLIIDQKGFSSAKNCYAVLQSITVPW